MTTVLGRTLALLVMVATTGCLGATATLDATGGGTLVYTYFPPKHATQRSERARLSAPRVRVVSFAGGKTTTATLAFDDVTALPTAEAFRDLVVERGRDDGVETLHVVVPPMPERLRKAALEHAGDPAKNKGPEITLTLPGPVVTARPDATVDGRTVTWTISLRDFAERDGWALDVAWRAPRDDAPHSM